MPLVPTCLHAFQIAFGKAQSICFPTLHQCMQQSEQRLPTVGLCFVQNFLLAYQKFSANSTCFGHNQATKGGGSGRGGERGFPSSPYMHFQMKNCSGRICGSTVEAWLHTSASRLQDKPVATRQYYAAETGQAAANSLH